MSMNFAATATSIINTNIADGCAFTWMYYDIQAKESLKYMVFHLCNGDIFVNNEAFQAAVVRDKSNWMLNRKIAKLMRGKVYRDMGINEFLKTLSDSELGIYLANLHIIKDECLGICPVLNPAQIEALHHQMDLAYIEDIRRDEQDMLELEQHLCGDLDDRYYFTVDVDEPQIALEEKTLEEQRAFGDACDIAEERRIEKISNR